MGQLSTKIYQKACIWDHSVTGDGLIFDMGITILGGDSINTIQYTVLKPLLFSAPTTDVNAGWAWSGGVGMINLLDTVAVLNANIGYWFTHIPAAPGYPKTAIGNTLNNSILFQSGGGNLIGGSILFNFTLMQNSV